LFSHLFFYSVSPDIIHHEDLEPYLIPIIKSLANDATEEEHRVEAATLFHNLAPVFGPELCMQVVLPLVVKLAEDSVFRVRKAIAANIGNVSFAFYIQHPFSPFHLPFTSSLHHFEVQRYVAQLALRPQHSIFFLYLLHYLAMRYYSTEKKKAQEKEMKEERKGEVEGPKQNNPVTTKTTDLQLL
jgi:hypothetical protein